MKDTAYGFVADEALSRGAAIAAHGAWRPPRIAIGALGAGAVRFGQSEDVLGLAEGIETALSAQQLTAATA
jgi:hypothetical protein